ncbi:kinase D-interacting substrate of 220 kDa B-like [Palaemon carinicauda]|uniref:kinase D-interacting substrate of 220 kDa B-like n=1 Tax=Palaemon carinicauda TaxID=392227 RepID=UPI0035B63551
MEGQLRHLLVIFLTSFVASVVLPQQIQFTPEQIQIIQQAADQAYGLNRTGPADPQKVQIVAADILNNPIISDLIRQHGLSDVQDGQGASLLTAAAKIGSLDVLKAALNAGAFIDLQDETGWTALNHAASKNHTGVARYLILVGANVNIPNNDFGDTPLIWAVYNENFELTKALVEAGANINHKEFDGDSPLNMASAPEKNTEIFKYLIDNGADVDDQDNDGWSALILAANHNKLDRVRMLLKANANPDLKTASFGDTALHWAVAFGYNDIVRELIVAGADFNLPNNRGVTPLNIAARNNLPNEVRLLLAAGAEIDGQAIDGDTSLMEATNSGFTEVVKVFLEHCPDLSIKNKNRKTVADIAFLRQRHEISNMILAHPNLVCTQDGIVYDAGHVRYDVCRQVKCCHGVWSPTGKSLETCGKGCRTLLAPAGVCTEIDNCPSLLSQVQEIIETSSDSYNEGYNFVQEYGCGHEGNTVKVCCPTQA